MLENIAIAASIISAITAVSTSLRAFGKSRERQKEETGSSARTASRASRNTSGIERSQSKNTLLYFMVTLIWIALSIMFLVPLWIGPGSAASDISLLPWILSYMILILIICVIWFRVLRQRP